MKINSHTLFKYTLAAVSALIVSLAGVSSCTTSAPLYPNEAETGSTLSARELIERDPSRAGVLSHHYESAYTETAPPRGYKPFYVSHFGRHGSRYNTGRGLSGPLKTLRSMDSLGLLTPKGEALMAAYDTLDRMHEGMYGYLTQRGSVEHQQLASRLYDRCPEIFDGERTEVLAVSSTVVRCCQSMMNFCTSLKGRAPQLDIVYVTNANTDAALTRVAGGSRNPQYGQVDNSMPTLDSLTHAWIESGDFIASIFRDTTVARRYMKGQDPQKWFYYLLDSGMIYQCLDGEDVPDITRFFTIDELYSYWRVKNPASMNAHGFTAENGEVLRRVAVYELRDILARADEALQSGSQRAADLRFSHDGGVLPLLCYLGLGTNAGTVPMGQEQDKLWYGFQNICMATNVQMIFYRSARAEDDVLVKFLHNEHETTMAALQPDYEGVYYRWSRLRPVLKSMADLDCE